MEHDVDLVVADVAAVWPSVEQAPQAWLAPSETRRLGCIADPDRAREFVASRALMRMLLSAHTGYRRGWWHWVVDAPENATPVVPACRLEGSALHLNLSHSQGLLACALSRATVGVDLEVQRSRQRSDLSGLIDMVCSPQEQRYIAELPDIAARHSAFMQIWTLKESCFKWQGTGLDLARLSTLCSRPQSQDGGEVLAHCATWAGDWAGRHYDLSVCTGELPGKVRAVALDGLHCLRPVQGRPVMLVSHASL